MNIVCRSLSSRCRNFKLIAVPSSTKQFNSYDGYLLSYFRTRLFSTSTAATIENANLTSRTHKLKAVYNCQRIDIVSMCEKMKLGRLLLENESLVVALPSISLATAHLMTTTVARQQSTIVDNAGSKITTPAASTRRRDLAQRNLELKDPQEVQNDRYCVYFSHGAVVFFNCDDHAQLECLEQCRPFSRSTPLMEPVDSEDYEIEINPDLDTWSRFAPNKLILKSLDVKSVDVISLILGQAVALRYFENEVDKLLENFEKTELDAVRILRQSNKVVRDVILKLGLLDHVGGHSPAWEDERYYKIWSGLRDEFEIEKRWRVLQTKTTFLQDNLRFGVELAHARTSERLEVAIIILISAELGISLYHLLV